MAKPAAGMVSATVAAASSAAAGRKVRRTREGMSHASTHRDTPTTISTKAVHSSKSGAGRSLARATSRGGKVGRRAAPFSRGRGLNAVHRRNHSQDPHHPNPHQDRRPRPSKPSCSRTRPDSSPRKPKPGTNPPANPASNELRIHDTPEPALSDGQMRAHSRRDAGAGLRLA